MLGPIQLMNAKTAAAAVSKSTTIEGKEIVIRRYRSGVLESEQRYAATPSNLRSFGMVAR